MVKVRSHPWLDWPRVAFPQMLLILHHTDHREWPGHHTDHTVWRSIQTTYGLNRSDHTRVGLF